MKICSLCPSPNLVINNDAETVTLGGVQCIPECDSTKIWDSEVNLCVCKPGFGWVNDSTICTQCEANEYSPGGQEICSPCPIGTVADAMSSGSFLQLKLYFAESYFDLI